MNINRVKITDIGRYNLRKSIYVTVEKDSDNSYTAYWPKVERIGYGIVQREALDDLKADIALLYDTSISEDDPEAVPENWKKLLNKLVIDKEMS